MGFAMSYTAFIRLNDASHSALVWSGTQANSVPFRAFGRRRSIRGGAFQNIFHV